MLGDKIQGIDYSVYGKKLIGNGIVGSSVYIAIKGILFCSLHLWQLKIICQSISIPFTTSSEQELIY